MPLVNEFRAGLVQLARDATPADPDSLRRVLHFILEQLEVLMSAFDSLEGAEAGVESAEQSLSSELTTALGDIQAEIQALQAQGVDPTRISSLLTRIQQVQSRLQGDVGTVSAADPGTAPAPTPAPSPAPAPAEPTPAPAPDQPAPAPDQPAPDQPAPSPAPTPDQPTPNADPTAGV